MGVADILSQIPEDTDLPLLLLHNVCKLRLQQAHMTAAPTSWMSDVVPLFDKMGVSSASHDLIIEFIFTYILICYIIKDLLIRSCIS